MTLRERQNELGKKLYRINANTLRGLAELQRDNIEKYLELNIQYLDNLPEVHDLSSFFELQRTYGESLWNSARESVKTRTDLLKGAVEETGGAIRSAFEADKKKKTAVAKPKKSAKSAKSKTSGRRTRKPAAKPEADAGKSTDITH